MRQSTNSLSAALAGAAMLSVTGIGGAAALPVAGVSPAAASLAVTTIQYHAPRRYYRKRGSHAGLYRCGAYAHHTHLSRQACR